MIGRHWLIFGLVGLLVFPLVFAQVSSSLSNQVEREVFVRPAVDSNFVKDFSANASRNLVQDIFSSISRTFRGFARSQVSSIPDTSESAQSYFESKLKGNLGNVFVENGSERVSLNMIISPYGL